MSYAVLILILGGLGLAYLKLPSDRLWLAIAMGVSYFLWGIWLHYQSKSLHWSIVLEYFSLALLGVSLLIFMGLRA
ncbi:MAG: hypothetical protein U1C50_01425 [Patescibacteria group bacterium]|nr:hypothetical protein [Patescibacteria group bacterium]MDP4031171.1 hypothetical protein [Candidatus Beckwithbacteria bacterium]MDZ4228898.1 hypothetical protein [Patescibacteria group bacterium]